MSLPNCADCSPPSDFQTALARLLRDGALRDLFARDRAAALAALRVKEEDRTVIAALDAGELEAQATVLLRKRLDTIRRWLPATLCTLRARAWPLFSAYARTAWPASPGEDARDFCRHLLCSVAPEVSAREYHRAEFAASETTLAVRLLSRPWALQFLLRRGRGVREWFVRFG